MSHSKSKDVCHNSRGPTVILKRYLDAKMPQESCCNKKGLRYFGCILEQNSSAIWLYSGINNMVGFRKRMQNAWLILGTKKTWLSLRKRLRRLVEAKHKICLDRIRKLFLTLLCVCIFVFIFSVLCVAFILWLRGKSTRTSKDYGTRKQDRKASLTIQQTKSPVNSRITVPHSTVPGLSLFNSCGGFTVRASLSLRLQ